jgi:hypothetical protein
LSFLLILVFPWLGFSGKQIAVITTILIITGEVTFYASIFILGKSFYLKIKDFFKFRKKNKDEDNNTTDQ